MEDYSAYVGLDVHKDEISVAVALCGSPFKDTPNGRSVASRPSSTAKVVALPRVGGLHDRYERRDAA